MQSGAVNLSKMVVGFLFAMVVAFQSRLVDAVLDHFGLDAAGLRTFLENAQAFTAMPWVTFSVGVVVGVWLVPPAMAWLRRRLGVPEENGPDLRSLRLVASDLERSFRSFLAHDHGFRLARRGANPPPLPDRYRANMLALLEKLKVVGLRVPDLPDDDVQFAAHGYTYLVRVHRLIADETLPAAQRESRIAAARVLSAEDVADLKARLHAE